MERLNPHLKQAESPTIKKKKKKLFIEKREDSKIKAKEMKVLRATLYKTKKGFS